MFYCLLLDETREMDKISHHHQEQKPFDGLKIDCYKFSDTGWDIVPAPSFRSWMQETEGHANKCLPLLSANQMGWFILNPVDFSVIWDGGKSPLSTKIILENEEYSKIIRSHFGFGTFTFQIPYIFRTSPGIGIFARGPTNFWIENAHALDGFIETNWSNYTFTMNWKCTKPNAIANFKQGDPICMIMPYPISLLENVETTFKSFSEAPQDMQNINRQWSLYRDAFNENKNRKPGEWQKDYFMGRKCPFSGNDPKNIGENHRTKFKLPRFYEQ
jgi:hypothetical protein